jgi:ElaB/YqjD/DUF883 family membrane-anchored ribosome-binding protein
MGSSGSGASTDNRIEQTRQTASQTVDKASGMLKDSIDRAASAARPAVDQLSQQAQNAVNMLSDMGNRASGVMSEKASQWRDMQDQVVSDARVKVREKPMTALAIAAAAGYILAKMMRR